MSRGRDFRAYINSPYYREAGKLDQFSSSITPKRASQIDPASTRTIRTILVSAPKIVVGKMIVFIKNCFESKIMLTAIVQRLRQ